jgi:hypothetical protein
VGHQPALDHAGSPTPVAQTVSQSFVSHAIYGVITVLAVLQVMEHHPPSAWSGAVTLFGTTLAVALLDAYSDSIAEMMAHGHMLSRGELGRIWRDVRPVLIGAQGPTLFLLLAVIGLLSVETAIDLAEGLSFLLLFVYGLRVGRLLHEGWPRQLLSGLILVAIGGFVVALKAVVH